MTVAAENEFYCGSSFKFEGFITVGHINIFLYWYSTATGHSWHSKLAFETIPMAVLSIILNVSLHDNINIILIT